MRSYTPDLEQVREFVVDAKQHVWQGINRAQSLLKGILQVGLKPFFLFLLFFYFWTWAHVSWNKHHPSHCEFTNTDPTHCLSEAFFFIVSHPKSYLLWEDPLGSLCLLIFLNIHSFIMFCILEVHVHHMEVPRLEAKLELQLPAYTTATTTRDLHHGSRQCQIPDPLNEGGDWTHILMDPHRVHFHCTTLGTPFPIMY